MLAKNYNVDLLSKLSDLSPPVPNGTFGRVAATFRLRDLCEIVINPSNNEERPPGRTATIISPNKSLNLDIITRIVNDL